MKINRKVHYSYKKFTGDFQIAAEKNLKELRLWLRVVNMKEDHDCRSYHSIKVLSQVGRFCHRSEDSTWVIIFCFTIPNRRRSLPSCAACVAKHARVTRSA